ASWSARLSISSRAATWSSAPRTSAGAPADRSFGAQRRHRFDPRRAAGRNETSEKRDRAEQDRDGHERRRIGGADAVQIGFQEPRQHPPARGAESEAGANGASNVGGSTPTVE